MNAQKYMNAQIAQKTLKKAKKYQFASKFWIDGSCIRAIQNFIRIS